jgi:predicted membrane chloride channel (bestrophin family)
LLPLALKNTDLQLQVALPASIFTVLLLLGVDAVAIQLENPFPYMPLQDLCNSTQRDVYRALDEHKLLLESAARNAGKPPPAGALKAAKGPKGRFIPRGK